MAVMLLSAVINLTLTFNRPTSVHIVDSTGKVLATGRQASTLNLKW